MSKENQVIFKITILLEIFIYLIPVPYMVYFVILAYNMDLNMMIYYLISASVGGAITVIPAYIFRNARLRPRLRHYFNNRGKLDEKELGNIKTYLLNYPIQDALFGSFRWLLGVTTALGIFSFFHTIDSFLIMLHIAGLFLTIPISFPVAYFSNESALTDVLLDGELANVKIAINTNKIFGIFTRIFLSFFSVLLVPVIILGYFVYLTGIGELAISHLWIHLLVLSILLLSAVMYSTYMLSRSLKLNLRLTSEVAERLTRGDLNSVIPVFSNDELGLMSMSINSHIRSLRHVVHTIQSEADSVRIQATHLNDYSNTLSGSIKEQSASVEEISAAIEEAGAATESISRGSEQQRNIIEKAAGMMDQLKVLIDGISSEAEAATNRAQNTHQNALTGERKLKDTINQMKEIHASTERISDAVRIINEIADQVNLLALNASIEAARAGEYGRGFAVVAQEISKLAENTQSNVNIIIQHVEQAVTLVNGGLKVVNETTNTFLQIIEAVKTNAVTITGINTNSDKQTQLSNDLQMVFKEIHVEASTISSATSEQNMTYNELIQNINTITDRSTNVSESAKLMRVLSRSLTESADTLSKEVSYFQKQTV